jgi:hypothetical protein
VQEQKFVNLHVASASRVSDRASICAPVAGPAQECRSGCRREADGGSGKASPEQAETTAAPALLEPGRNVAKGGFHGSSQSNIVAVQ